VPPLTREQLDALGLSEEQRAAVEQLNSETVTLSDQVSTLRSETREQKCDGRIEELKAMGFAEKPGALKHYRSVFLGDDDGPAVVVLSDKGEKQKLTALQILDQFIDGLKGDKDRVQFSDQHLASGHDDPPPADDTDADKRPVADRVADMKAALGRA